jgi:hypothetical protein
MLAVVVAAAVAAAAAVVVVIVISKWETENIFWKPHGKQLLRG